MTDLFKINPDVITELEDEKKKLCNKLIKIFY